jgi:hypothetical protein
LVKKDFNRREIVQSALATAASLAAGCGGGSTPGAAPTTRPSQAPSPSPSPTASAVANPQPIPSGALTQGSVSVTVSSSATIGQNFAGLSYEKEVLADAPYHFGGANTDLIGMFRRLGPSILRIGGNSVDHYSWTANGTGQTTGQIAPADVDALAAFLEATGWKCLYGINLGGAGPNPYTSGNVIASTTPALAAAEIAYVYATLGASLIGFEIGNEVDLYGDSYFTGTNWNVSAFEALWSEFRAAIVAETPAVAAFCTGPASAGHEPTWTVPFGDWATSQSISLLTQHYYRGNGLASPEPTAADLVLPDPTLVQNLATLKAGAAGIAPNAVPFRISECNSYYNGGAPGVSDGYGSSLWILDFIFDCVAGGAAGTNFHGGGNGPGYTPIADSSGTVVAARPEFYGILLFTLAGIGTLYATTLAGIGNLNVTAYAIKTSSGISLIVVNKDPAQNLQLTVGLPTTVHAATLLEMTQLSPGASGPDITATAGVTIGGASVNVDGSFSPADPYTLGASGDKVTCYVPYYSAVLVRIT